MAEFFRQVGNFFLDFFSGYGLVLVKAIAVFVLGLLTVLLVRRSVKKTAIKSRKLDNSASSFVTSMITLVLYVILILVIIGTLGFSTAGILGMFSSVILAIALGMQNTLASLTNGIVLIFTKPFQAGDFVDIGGTTGTVKEIKLFSVKLVTTDNLTVVVPNSQVLNSVITNYSRMPLRRLEIVVPVSYGVDVAQVKEVVGALVKADKRIVELPAPFFRLTEYGSSSLNFTLRVWTSTEDFWGVKFDLLESILGEFRTHNIEIPFNQLDVHVLPTPTETSLEKTTQKEGV